MYAHRQEAPRHEDALAALSDLAQEPEPWGVPVFCVGEFVRVVTHPRLFDPPSTLEEALAALDRLRASPTLRILQPGDRFFDLLLTCLIDGDARGNLAFDAMIAAVCLEHGARQLLTLDRDFRRFDRIEPIGLDSV